MKTVAFTRQQVIRALLREPLIHMEYVENPRLDEVGGCRVCAVGAVLRGARLTNRQINRVGTSNLRSDGGDLLRDLEMEFECGGIYGTYSGEHTKDGYPNGRLRARLVRYVRRAFPARFTLTLPDRALKGDR